MVDRVFGKGGEVIYSAGVLFTNAKSFYLSNMK